MPVRFLSLEQVLGIHRDEIDLYGGEPGVRDTGLLESALAMPAATFGGQFLHRDIFEMAAAYLFHIAKNHPFLDGNKRVGVAAANTFLILNGHELDVPQTEIIAFVLALAQSERTKTDAAVFVRRYARPIPPSWKGSS